MKGMVSQTQKKKKKKARILFSVLSTHPTRKGDLLQKFINLLLLYSVVERTWVLEPGEAGVNPSSISS